MSAMDWVNKAASWKGVGIFLTMLGIFLTMLGVYLLLNLMFIAGVWLREANAEMEDEPPPVLTAYIYPTATPHVTLICVSYTTDVERWGGDAPGYCHLAKTEILLEKVEKQHQRRLQSLSEDNAADDEIIGGVDL